MRNISMHLNITDNTAINTALNTAINTSNNVSGINRNSPSRGSIRILPPMAPNNDIKPILRSNPSNNMRNDSEMQSFNHSLNHNRVSGPPLPNHPMTTNCEVIGNQMFYNQYYDSNNYLSHTINKCQQISKNDSTVGQSSPLMAAPNACALQSTTTSTTAVMNNGMTSANLNINSMSNSRGSLEDPGVDVGRISPSTSSNDSRKSRYSTASLDSGRGSDTKTNSGQSHRVSVHSCESLGSSTGNRDNFNRTSSSSSSIGSGNSVTNDGEINTISTPTVADPNWTPVSVGHSIAGPLSIPEMVLHGIADEEIIYSWLSRIHFEEYANNFIRAGYDMPTISRMTPEDLTAIGITKPQKRQILKTEIQRLSISDGIPIHKPNSLSDWLKILRLEQYFSILCQQGYDSIDRVCELAWEDLEEVGIRKLGHQKKILLAIKKVRSLNSNSNRSQGLETSKMTLPLIYTTTTGADVCNRPLNDTYMSVNTQYQESVPIKMFAPTKSTPSPTTEKPITPQLKTFQQLPNGYVFCRQRSDAPYYGLIPNDGQNSVFQSSRGRSLESLDNNESNYYQNYYLKQQQRHAFNAFPKQNHFCGNELIPRDSDQIHGYETDSEIIQSYANNRKCFYEIDGTATLHRPKGLIKAKPVAKIVAKSRQIDPQMYCNEPQKNSSIDKMDSNLQNSYIYEENPNNTYLDDMSSQMYGSLKKKKIPPPPPKRVNSMRNSTNCSPVYSGPIIPSFSPQHSVHRSESYDEFQEQVFATCVKSLTSRFNNNSEDLSGRQSKNSIDSNDFPPPPSPLHFNECQNYNTLQRRKDKSERCDRDCNISSSSSTESMPFANDNIGTIKQRTNNDFVRREIHSPSPSFTSSAPSSLTNSPSPSTPKPFISADYSMKTSDSKMFAKGLSPTKHKSLQPSVDTNGSTVRRVVAPDCGNSVRANPLDPLDDIETMLVNLSNQLDLMLETNHNNRMN